MVVCDLNYTWSQCNGVASTPLTGTINYSDQTMSSENFVRSYLSNCPDNGYVQNYIQDFKMTID